MEDLQALGGEGFKVDVIVVDAKKDRRLSMLKQLIVTLVKRLSTNPAAIIKKIAGLVFDFYKRANVESPAKAALKESSHMFESCGVQMLGQIKHGSCRPRAILFKVLEDTVGLESRLIMGFPNDGASDYVDSYNNMYVIIVLNYVELLVDLMRFPGQLLPRSIKSILMTHISALGESDSTKNGKLSLSHREPNIATSFGRRSRRKVIVEQRTASSSPEHPLFQARGQFKLVRDKTAFRDFADDQATSRSSYKLDGASLSEVRRIRRRSISVTLEVGDDTASTVYNITRFGSQNSEMKMKREPSRVWQLTKLCHDSRSCTTSNATSSTLRSNVMTTPILQHFVSEGTATLSTNSAPTLPGANKGTQDIESSQIQVNANLIQTKWATLQ
ncbi:hypothetical protein KIW84_052901 [Lathyrus oleraceus]|uniref:EDR1/CTR1/ARMC3-like peptidase-like domain-containing protein n=1 Tax=Pisum sativum TaxID=3888 RepID=A0A9D4WR47_PEA|nr:hypothetical protein KIW84_052901 [Pisum sativum]